MSKNKRLIGVYGNCRKGITDVISMINYITYNGTVRSTYANFLETRKRIDDIYRDFIIGVDDSVKDVISTLYNIDRSIFDDERKCIESWYLLDDRKFVGINKTNEKFCYEITRDDLSNDPLWKILNITRSNYKKPAIRLSTLIRHIKHFVIKDNLGLDVWNDNLYYRMDKILSNYGYCVVRDVMQTSSVGMLERHEVPHVLFAVVNTNLPPMGFHSSNDYKVEVNKSMFYEVLECVNSINLKYGTYQ